MDYLRESRSCSKVSVNKASIQPDPKQQSVSTIWERGVEVASVYSKVARVQERN